MKIFKLYEQFIIILLEKEIKMLKYKCNLKRNILFRKLYLRKINELETLLIFYYKKYYENSNDN